MLAIGRALMLNPQLLILDEATEGLAPVIRQEIWGAVDQLKRNGQSILIVDKTLKALLPLADALLLPPLFTAHAENDATLWRQQRWLRSLPPARLAPELRGCLPAEPAALRGALHAVIAPLEALGFAETPADYLVGVHAAV